MSHHSNQRWARIALLALPLAMSACGGGGSTTTVGGTVSGLPTLPASPVLPGDSVVLQNNGGDETTVSTNGDFKFPGLLRNGDDYNVAVSKHPVGETCTVSNGSGRINHLSDPIDNVQVLCVATSSVGGIVTGLGTNDAVVLLDTYTISDPAKDSQSHSVSANGWFAFPGLVVPSLHPYSVTVQTQPEGKTCTVTGGNDGKGGGTYTAGVMSAVVVTCTVNTP